MTKCLVTKLQGSVANSSLIRLGEIRIKLDKVDNPTEHTQGFGLDVVKPVTLEIIGDGYFTDKTLEQNLGKTKVISSYEAIWVSNGAEIAILDKYSLRQFTSYYPGESISQRYGENIHINLYDLKYSHALTYISLDNTQVSGDIGDLNELTALTYLSLNNTQVSGDIGNLKTLTALTNLNMFNTKVSGDIGNLKTLTALTNLNMFSTKVSGDIGNLKTLTALTYLSLFDTQVNGDIGNLKTLTALTYLSLSNTTRPITGDIGKLSTLTNVTEISLRYSKITGDLAIISNSCRFISLQNDVESTLTWSTRPSNAKIIAIEGNASLTNIDKMLQDQANGQIGFKASDMARYKVISVAGNRTSASDDAVAALQQKGYTISIAKA